VNFYYYRKKKNLRIFYYSKRLDFFFLFYRFFLSFYIEAVSRLVLRQNFIGSLIFAENWWCDAARKSVPVYSRCCPKTV